ncbi:jg9726 [Pararge aegeria aegeria]|uniref:Jg9726 protein n=1 Tax=Pararge aegeria aegeria TaxID=348720 RepID=A0A8S4SLY2_9NEOP|nr:jg9726 [Pararge aegeria aegeria]
MDGAHSSENRWTLGFQGAGMATPYRLMQLWSTPNEVDRRHQASRWEPLATSGPGWWNLELPTKDLCPAVDIGLVVDVHGAALCKTLHAL